MADERIVLSYDPAEAVAAANKANKAIEANEKTAERAGAAIGKSTEAQITSIVSITDRSQKEINRIVQQAERKAAFAGASSSERLQIERKLQLSRVAGDPNAINRMTAAYDKLALAQDKVTAGGSKLAEFLRNPMQAAGDAVDSIAASLGRVGAIALGVGAGLTVVAKASFDLVASQGRAAEAVTNFADTVGISATEAYKLDIQAKLVGSSLEGLTAGYKKLSQGIAEGTEEGKKSAEALEKNGVRIFELSGQVRPFGDLFGDIAKKIQSIKEPSERAAKAVEIFGKSGVALMPLLLQFDETAERAKRASGGVNDTLLKTLADTDDAIGEIEASWKSLKLQLAGGIVATIKFVQSINKGPLDYIDPGIGSLSEDAARQRQARLNETNRGLVAAEGAALIAKFKKQQGETDAGLKERLADVTEQRKAAEQFGSGMGAAEVQKRIDLAKKLRAEEASLTAQIKARAEAEQKAEQARRDREKGIEKAREIMAQRAAGGFKVDVIKDLEAKPVNELYEKQFRAAQKLSEETVEMELANLREQLSQEEIFAQASRDKQLAQAEGYNAKTVEQKIAVEDKKAAIEKEYLLKNFELKARLLQAEQEIELAKAAENAELRAAINQKYALAGRELTLKTEAAIAAAGDTAAIKSGQIIQDQLQRNFDSIKHAAEGLFDTLFLRTKSWGDLLKNAVLLPALTYLKQIASTAVASALTGTSGGGSGSASGIGGLLGGLLAGGGIARAGAPGGTPGFAGPVGGLSGMLGGGAGGGTAGGLDALGLLTQLGQIGATNKLFAEGIYGAKGGALLLGGGLLATDGLRRGGVGGMFETAAGGALIGAKFGGPWGALIGGAIGLGAGALRMMIKGATEKARDQIKEVYGIDVKEKGILNQIVKTAKESFGGDIGTAIRSPQIRELIELYAMSTGQGFGVQAKVRSVSLAQSNFGLLQNATFENGRAIAFAGIGSSTPSLTIPGNPGGVGYATNYVGQGQMTNIIKLDGPATTKLLRGEAEVVIDTQPRRVQDATAVAQKGNYGRRELVAQQNGKGEILK